ncbi:MAG: GGDEF domain-containing protein [Sumerlaeia bacterium]
MSSPITPDPHQDQESPDSENRLEHRTFHSSETLSDVIMGGKSKMGGGVSGGSQLSARRLPVLITLDGGRVGERFVLSKKRSILGRDFQADVLVSDGEVSRRHAAIEWVNFDDKVAIPDCLLLDIKSTNGTFVNNRVLQGSRTLNDGDQIRLGKTLLGYYVKDERVLELDRELLDMALRDELTGVYKRRYFINELHREFDRSRRYRRPFGLLLLDIDHFKNVNDELGHLRGDEALKTVADVIRSTLREGDICGRYGGEEFVILLPETDRGGAVIAAERIRQALEATSFKLGTETPRRITASIGIAAQDGTYQDKMDVIEAADTALYSAKRLGRNRCEVAVGADSSTDPTDDPALA